MLFYAFRILAFMGSERGSVTCYETYVYYVSILKNEGRTFINDQNDILQKCFKFSV